MIAYALVLWWGAGLLAHRLTFGAAEWGTPAQAVVRVAGAFVLVVVASYGLTLMSIVGHDGTHLQLADQKLVSVFIGMACAALVPGSSALGFAINHWDHHRFTNTDSDPDCVRFRRFKSPLSRLFTARLVANLSYKRNIIALAGGKPLPFKYRYMFKREVAQKLARFNLGLIYAVLAGYALFFALDWRRALMVVALPTLIAIPISGLQPFLEHQGTEVGHGIDTRSRTSLLMTILYFGNNYHLEHHMYPSVPSYRLPAVHRYLRSVGFFEAHKAHLDRGYFSAYWGALTGKYPEGHAPDAEADPFLQKIANSEYEPEQVQRAVAISQAPAERAARS
jgi:fatty acid desaturase